MGTKRKQPDATKVAFLLLQGKKRRDIAKRVGCGLTFITKVAKAIGAVRNPGVKPEHSDREFLRMYREAMLLGWTTDRFARSLDYSPPRVRRRLNSLRRKGFKV
jgi:transposase